MLLLALLLAAADPTPEPREILRRAVAHQERMLKLGDQYNYSERVVQRRLDDKGRITKTEITTFDVVRIDGAPVRRLVARDDRPLAPDEAKQVARDLDRNTCKLVEEHRKRRRQREQINREALEAFDFRIAARDDVDGVGCYVLEAKPRREYKPRTREVGILKHMAGRLWISQAENYLVKFEAQVTEPISFGWFLGKLDSGSRVQLEQGPVHEEAWFPTRVTVEGAGRVIVKRIRIASETTYSDYKKFRVDTRVTPLGATP